jgi:hypothetical protein
MILYFVIFFLITALIYVNYNKIIEGQSIHSYKYNEFQSILNDDALDNKEIQDRIKNYSENENLAYNIYLNDYVKQVDDIYDKSYENYINDLNKFTKKNKYKGIKFSDKQLDLFKNKYDPSLMASNDYNYVDIKDYENVIKNKQQNKVGLPGLIAKTDGKVINNMVNYTSNSNLFNSPGFNTFNKYCCNLPDLDIENQRILYDDTLSNEQFRNDVRELSVRQITDPDEVLAYNYPYYTYMRDSDNIFDPLYKNYKKSRDYGSISL